MGETYRISNILVFVQMFSVQVVVDHVTESSREVRVFDPSVFRFQLKATIDAQMQCVFPSLQ